MKLWAGQTMMRPTRTATWTESACAASLGVSIVASWVVNSQKALRNEPDQARRQCFTMFDSSACGAVRFMNTIKYGCRQVVLVPKHQGSRPKTVSSFCFWSSVHPRATILAKLALYLDRKEAANGFIRSLHAYRRAVRDRVPDTTSG